jgi:hypothetical protein
MTWRFDPTAWLAKSREATSAASTPATPATIVGGLSENVAGVAIVAASNHQSQDFTEAEPTVPAPALPSLVQAALDQWLGATITAVRLSQDSAEFPPTPGFWTDPPLSYAEGSRASTAALGAPTSRTRWAAKRQWREDFGS